MNYLLVYHRKIKAINSLSLLGIVRQNESKTKQ